MVYATSALSLALVAASGVFAEERASILDCVNYHQVNYYEMLIPPDVDGFGNPAKQGNRMVDTPARLLGDGFGSRAAGDFGAPLYAGLQLDGTARFVDTGTHGSNGFLLKQNSSFGGSLYLRMKVNADTLGSDSAFAIGIGGANDGCMCLAFRTDGIRLVDNSGVIAASGIIDMTAWRTVRIQQARQTRFHGGTDGVSYVRVFVDEVSDLNEPVIGWTIMYDRTNSALERAPVQAGGDGWWLLLGSDAETTQVDFTVDWVRMTGSRDVYEDPVLGRIYMGHPFGLIEPQAVYDDPDCLGGTYSNNVWSAPCDWRVYPHYYASTIVEKNATTATPSSITYQVVNTSYDNAGGVSWAVQEVDSGGTPTNYDWLDLDKSGGTLGAAQGSGDTVTATLNSNVSGLPGGWTIGYLKFTNSTCTLEEIRPIYVAVRDPADFLVYEYCGDVPPTQNDSAGPGLRFRQWGIQNDGQTYPDDAPDAIESENSVVEDVVTPDPRAWNGKALKLIEGAGQRSVFLSDDNEGSNDVAGYPIIDRLLGATVVARFRVVYPRTELPWLDRRAVGIHISGSASLWPYPSDRNMGDVWASLVYVADTEPRVMDGPRRGQGFLDAMSRPGLVGSADGYHVIRLAVVPGINDDATTLSVAQDAPMMANAYGRKIVIWFDEHLGNTEPVVEIYNTNQYQAPGNWTSYHGFQFGLQEQLAGHEAWYDWISFTNAGAFGPGEEVALIGKSLIPTKCRACNMEYWADIDVDNDVDQDDYARFQRCYSGSDNPYPVTPGYCSCFDRDGDGDIDAEDLAAFTSCTTGPGIAGPPASCAQ